MVYTALKFLFSFAVRAYFRTISIRNAERIPLEGPVIFVANHTSAFMDPIVLGRIMKRKLYFLARGEAFRGKFLSRILYQLNMIPVYRPEVTPDKVYLNADVFQKCFDHLAHSRALLIFPEGFSKTERRLRKIKTGTARIALGAEAQNGFSLGLQIVPIGINYSDPHRFQSDLFINIGTPIVLAEFKAEYLKDPYAASEKLTHRIAEELKERTIVTEHDELDELIINIEKIYGDELRESGNSGIMQKGGRFLMSKEVVRIVNYFYTIDRARVIRVQELIEIYLSGISRYQLSNSFLSRRTAVATALYAILLLCALPVFIYGFVNNFVAFKITAFLSNRFVPRDDFKGSMQLAFGVLLFLICYLVQTCLVGYFFGVNVAFVYLITLFPAGLVALEYLKIVHFLRKHFVLQLRQITQPVELDRLARLRDQIINELNAARNDFNQRTHLAQD